MTSRGGRSRLYLIVVLATTVGAAVPAVRGLVGASPVAAQATVPPAANKLISEGYDLQANGRHTEAIEKFKAALELAPQFGEAHQYIATSYQALGDGQKALFHYQRAHQFAASDVDRELSAGRIRALQEALASPPAPATSPVPVLTPGRGVLTTAAGDRYEGDIVAGQRTGRGVQLYANGDRYDGEWLSDRWHGRGLLIYGAGGRYDGEWKNGQMDGRGLRIWPDDEGRYDGEWRNGLHHGRGLRVWKGNLRYDGDWIEGRLHGRGLFIFPDGGRYDGEWQNNKRSGRGLRIWPDLSRYDGEWADDKPNGSGTATMKDGTFTGTWKNGCLQGPHKGVAAGVDKSECGS